MPYATLPVLAATLSVQASRQNWRWDLGTTVLVLMSATIVFLLVWRQYVALLQNRRLYTNLSDISQELENRVADLAQMNQRLEDLNDSSHRLTSLRQPLAVARAGLQTACDFTGSPGGWISIGEGADYTVLTYGVVEGIPYGDPEVIEDARQRGVLRVVPLRIRDRTLGTMLLLEASQPVVSTDLLPLVAAHLASALDNAKRYDEALQLAERDPLTGLFNHRGIHRRLAGEALRAQQSDSQLSLIMIDLDDFKVLNDTYGHVAGDLVLRQVSDAIRSVLRHADLAGRVGGDELLLVLPNTGADGALQLGERLRTALAARPYLTAEGESVPVYLSLGAATMPDDTRVGRRTPRTRRRQPLLVQAARRQQQHRHRRHALAEGRQVRRVRDSRPTSGCSRSPRPLHSSPLRTRGAACSRLWVKPSDSQKNRCARWRWPPCCTTSAT